MLTRYEKEGEAILGNTGVYVCTICGFMFVGDSPPQICPVYKVPSWKFAAYVFMFALPTGAADTENRIIDEDKCIGCGVCANANACPSGAISMVPKELPSQQPKADFVKAALTTVFDGTADYLHDAINFELGNDLETAEQRLRCSWYSNCGRRQLYHAHPPPPGFVAFPAAVKRNLLALVFAVCGSFAIGGILA